MVIKFWQIFSCDFCAANHVYTGLVADPQSNSLVLNSQDGILQFYRPDKDSLAFTVSYIFSYLHLIIFSFWIN